MNLTISLLLFMFVFGYDEKNVGDRRRKKAVTDVKVKSASEYRRYMTTGISYFVGRLHLPRSSPVSLPLPPLLSSVFVVLVREPRY